MPNDYSQSYRQRWRQIGAEGFLEELCPGSRARIMVCRRVAETIRAANSLNPHSWGLTWHSDGLRLNFGRLEAILWVPGSVGVMVDFLSAPNKTTLKKLESLRRSSGSYRSAPDSHYVWSDTANAADLNRFLAFVREFHAAHLDLASRTDVNGVTAKGHHPGMVDAIGHVAGRALPQPDYVTISRPKDAPVFVTPKLVPATAKPAARSVYEEGALREIVLEAIERDPRARAACIDAYGTQCAVCGMSFKERYGDAASGLIHVHHLKPLRRNSAARETDAIRDLRPVCPNCHAVIHRRRKPYSIKEVKTMLGPG